MINLIAISGSLRKKSSNRLLLSSCANICQASVNISQSNLIATLPLFNPDIEGDDFELPAPSTVSEFRQQLAHCDGIIIASPEYAHGVTGVIKNALDWLVASGELVSKPVMILNASPRADIAYAALTETISVMDAKICHQASITVAMLGTIKSQADLLDDPQIVQDLKQAISVFTRFIEQQQGH